MERMVASYVLRRPKPTDRTYAGMDHREAAYDFRGGLK